MLFKNLIDTFNWLLDDVSNWHKLNGSQICIKLAWYRLNLDYESLVSEFVALCEHDAFPQDVTDHKDAIFETGIGTIKNR